MPHHSSESTEILCDTTICTYFTRAVLQGEDCCRLDHNNGETVGSNMKERESREWGGRAAVFARSPRTGRLAI